jgi:hypothetical protein
MADPRLIRADATKLDELRGILAQQEGCGIASPDRNEGYIHRPRRDNHVVGAVRSLTPGKKVLMVTGPTKIMSGAKTSRKRYSRC